MEKINTIMLIDDNPMDNRFNQIIIRKCGIEANIMEFLYAEKALNTLKDPTQPRPDLILLDINMPRMNGFEFLDAYQTLQEEERANVLVIMLTTSLNPDDEKHAKQYAAVSNFMNKPLSVETFKQLLEEHFSD